MNKLLIFLLEEESMSELLNVLLPRFLSPLVDFKLVHHNGKQELEKAIPYKLRRWQAPDIHFVIVRDQKSDDCVKLKQRLKQLCQQAGQPDALVRIACHELESWFLGDLAAVEKAFKIKGLARQQNKKKYREPDKLANAAEELQKLVKNYKKVSGACAIAPHLNLTSNRSHSFQVLISGVQKFAQQ
jgi:hypothetical protein